MRTSRFSRLVLAVAELGVAYWLALAAYDRGNLIMWGLVLVLLTFCALNVKFVIGRRK